MATRPERRKRRTLGAGLSSLALTACLLTAPPTAAGAESPPASTAAPTYRGGSSARGLAAGVYAVTLITGDRVTLKATAGGGYSVQVEAAPRADGSEPVIEVTSTRAADGEMGIYALPADVLAYIDAGRLDRELFNIRYLAAHGFHDRAADRIPVIVELVDQLSTKGLKASTVPAVTVTTALESIGAAAGTVDPDQASSLWAALTGAAPARASAQPLDLGSGIERIWLDHVVEVSLDESVAQIGAPGAWAAGFDGTGVDVAVLDTGIDPGHSDIQDKIIASRSFIAGETVTDGHGHGTHVASIAAGTGAASDGRFTGVAPGADLIVGKVLNNAGTGLESGVIEGMEWAAATQDADIVNLSLGSVPTDGTDPASQAVDRLTATTGALFVIAAGNTGRTFSVSSPGAASAALTVGAVDGADQLAGFSSRGPRVGNYAMKPEITAPGVSITAARAAGTRLGAPVGDDYVSASGTSMATPHVAGAAALLAQQHPEWGPEQLKAALVATAADGGHHGYEQGSGRVDLGRAVGQPVQVAPATADFGLVPSPAGTAPRTRVVTYTNPTDRPVTLELGTTLRSFGGDPVEGVLAVEPASVEIPAGGTATAAVSLNPAALGSGLYGGAVVATGSGGLRLRTPVGLVVGEQQHTLRITVAPRAGVKAFQFRGLLMFGVQGLWAGESISCGAADCPQDLDFLVADGTYSVRALVAWQDADGERQLALLVDPEVTVSDDTTIVLDANQARQVTVHTERPAAPVDVSSFSLYRSSSDGTFQHINHIFAGQATQTWWVTPTPAVTKGQLAVSTHHLLAPAPEDEPPGYLYSLKVVEQGRIPDSLDYRFADRDLVKVDNHYHDDQPGRTYRKVWLTWAPWEFVVSGVAHPTLHGQTRVREYVTPAPDHLHERGIYTSGVFGPVDETIDVYPSPGHRDVRWNEQPNVPGAVVLPRQVTGGQMPAPLWWWVCSGCRQGDNFYPFLHRTAAGERHTLGQFGRPFGYGETHLYRDGVEVPEAAPFYGAFTTYQLPPEPASYRLTLAHRNTQTAWRFTSSRPAAEATPAGHTCVETRFAGTTAPCQAQPLLFLRYDTDVDIDNRVPVPNDHKIDITVYRQDQTAEVNLRGLRLWISTDDGAAWQEVEVMPLGDGRYRAKVHHPPVDQTSGQVSLRADAWDADGNRIEQTIIGAFGLRGR